MASKRILILGGGRYNVPSIRAVREAGFVTLVADRNANAPGLGVADHALAIDLNDCDSLVAGLNRFGGIDGVVSMAEVGVRAAATISTRLGLPSISGQSAANATSKAEMRRCWQSLPEYSTEFEVVATPGQAEQASHTLGLPLIVKPDRSFGGSRGVTRVNSFDEIEAAFTIAKSGGLSNSDVVIEPCVEGTEHSAEVLIWRGKTSVLCTGQKIKSLLPYRVDVSVQYPARLTPDQERKVSDMAHKAVNALGLTQGVAHIEFAYTNSGPVLFELGARCGGGHTPQIAHHVSGVHEFVEACRMACGIAPTQFTPSTNRGADYRFLIFPPGEIESIEIPPSVASRDCVLDVGITLQPGNRIGPLYSTSDRAGFLVTLGKNLDEAAACADRGCQQISIRYRDGSVHHASELSDFRELTRS